MDSDLDIAVFYLRRDRGAENRGHARVPDRAGCQVTATVTAARAPPTKAAAVRKRSPASMTKPAQHHRGAQVAIGAVTNKISAERSCYPSFSES